MERVHRIIDVVMQECYMRWFDFEKDNPRTPSGLGGSIALQLRSMSSSHGQTMLAAPGGLAEILKESPEPS